MGETRHGLLRTNKVKRVTTVGRRELVEARVLSKVPRSAYCMSAAGTAHSTPECRSNGVEEVNKADSFTEYPRIN